MKKMNQCQKQGYFSLPGPAFLTFASLAFSIQGFGLEKPKILWGLTHLPPGMIIEGPLAKEGHVDLNLKSVQMELNNYQHDEFILAPARIGVEAKEGKNFCGPSFFKTPERLDMFYFAKLPLAITGARGIVIRVDRRSEFPAGESVSLEEILTQGKLTGMIAQGRKQGKGIDEVIEKHKDKLKYRSASDPALGLYEMLRDKRIDFTIAPDHELNWMTKDWTKEEKDSLVLIPISETKDFAFLPIYIACVKNEWGKGIISEVDKVMEKLVQKKEFQERPLKWQTDTPLYHQWYKKLVLDLVK